MKIYGIYEGCIFEGGGVREKFYKNKEDALKEVERFAKKENKLWIQAAKDSCLGDCEVDLYKEDSPGHWKTTVDEIKIIERTLV